MTYIYLHGFASTPQSTKARYYQERFRELGLELDIPALAPDFSKLTFTSQIEIVAGRMTGCDDVTLIGSSMGGYVATLAASRYPQVRRLVLLAPAFGFSRRWADMLGGERVEQWRTTGWLDVFHYGAGRPLPLGYDLVTDAARYPEYPEVTQPALVLHGRHDPVVPLAHSETFVGGNQNRVLVVYESGHELTDVLRPMWERIVAFLGLPVPGQLYQKS